MQVYFNMKDKLQYLITMVVQLIVVCFHNLLYGSVPDCNTSGILGTITGVIGTLQATEVIKMICMPKYVMQNKLLTWNALTQSIFNLKIQRSADALKHVPIDKNAFALFDYPAFCGEPEIQKLLLKNL